MYILSPILLIMYWAFIFVGDITLRTFIKSYSIPEGSSSGFKNGASVDAEYLYDANGNMTRDLNKGIKDIKYNELNLPESISFADGRKISYIYEYNICDHLGNVRAVVDGARTVKQQSNYYPFGGFFS